MVQDCSAHKHVCCFPRSAILWQMPLDTELPFAIIRTRVPILPQRTLRSMTLYGPLTHHPPCSPNIKERPISHPRICAATQPPVRRDTGAVVQLKTPSAFAPRRAPFALAHAPVRKITRHVICLPGDFPLHRDFAGFYRVLPGFTGWLPGFWTRFPPFFARSPGRCRVTHRVPAGFYRVHQPSTRPSKYSEIF
jgi:hypothetical protein